MDSEFIYNQLLSKSISDHYTNRYIKFIISCIKTNVNIDLDIYTEKHHILPKSLFIEYVDLRSNPWNCSVLTARQHFIAHWILARALGGNMWHAFQFMCFAKTKKQNRNYKISSKCYSDLRNNYNISEETKQKISKANKGKQRTFETKQKLSKINKSKKHSDETKRKISLKSKGKNNSMYGKKHTEESIKKRSRSMKGKKHTEESIKKRSRSMKGKNTGPKSEESKIKMSESKKNQPIIRCPNCGKLGKGAMMKRWHFDNCKW
jgi:hypothetical protein